ncbi:PCI domain-containing protein 2-like isoform X2 [Halichondria panicea]|uniref:PCI domain-containing protein 2-like isoform X2 n=1 Tax=Halichondria panicea TaxID=6063 RepID=UPI00312B62B3
MAYGTINTYLQHVERALQACDGALLAELVSFRHPHVQNPRLQDDFENKCQAYLEPPFDEMVAAHIRGVGAQRMGDVKEMCACQTIVVQSFLRALQAQKEENWALPVLKMVVLDLRLFALRAEKDLVPTGKAKPGEMLEKAADAIMSCFRVCVSDSRTSLEYSKKWGTLALVNQLMKIYFKINKLHLCKPLIRAIDSSDIKDQFSMADLVTYKYFVGKKAMFDSEFKKAAEYLQFAFNHCHITARKNKRLILTYLVPVKLLLGHLPQRVLLQKYKLLQFEDISKAVSQGNLLLLAKSMKNHEPFFIHYRVYLILEKLKMITYRNLFKKVYLLMGTFQLPLAGFLGALHSLGEKDMDVDEVQCILANLIDKAFIRGYISHQHQKLVVSKQNPFPTVSTVLKQQTCT